MDKIDILNRTEFVERLVALTENISNNKKSVSFAVDGEWGVGKSFVLDMYEERLSAIQSEETAADKYFVVRYNCWKYDYYEEPLIAIVSSLIETIDNKTKLFPDSEKKSFILGALKAVGYSLLSFANTAIKEGTGFDAKKCLKKTKQSIENEQKRDEEAHKYDSYFAFNKMITKLKKTLGELSSEYTIVFLVDELDRCLPQYAIKVLERLHHLTDGTANILTVLSIDKGKLLKSIHSIFGHHESKYLKKFIQFEILLQAGSLSDKITDKYSEYIALFDNSFFGFEDSIEEFMRNVFKKLTIRDQEQLMERVELVHKLLFDKPKDYSFMCMELLIAVLSTHYNDRKGFTKWFKDYYAVIEGGTQEPPFNSFFEEKFSQLTHRIIRGLNIKKEELIFQERKSLYAAIAYMWFNLFMKNNSYKLIGVEVVLRGFLDSNIEELKKFDETIRMIK